MTKPLVSSRNMDDDQNQSSDNHNNALSGSEKKLQMKSESNKSLDMEQTESGRDHHRSPDSSYIRTRRMSSNPHIFKVK